MHLFILVNRIDRKNILFLGAYFVEKYVTEYFYEY